MKQFIVMASVALATIAAVFATGGVDSIESVEPQADRYERAFDRAKDEWRRRIAENRPDQSNR